MSVIENDRVVGEGGGRKVPPWSTTTVVAATDESAEKCRGDWRQRRRCGWRAGAAVIVEVEAGALMRKGGDRHRDRRGQSENTRRDRAKNPARAARPPTRYPTKAPSTRMPLPQWQRALWGPPRRWSASVLQQLPARLPPAKSTSPRWCECSSKRTRRKKIDVHGEMAGKTTVQ